MNKPFQRKGTKSNAHVGKEFEQRAQKFFSRRKLSLRPNISVKISVNGKRKKKHAFDLVDLKSKVLVECKSHKWTEGKNVPSAKITLWNEAMYLFFCAGRQYRRILFVLYDYSKERKATLAKYYIRINSHLIPKGVEIWEYNEGTSTAEKINYS